MEGVSQENGIDDSKVKLENVGFLCASRCRCGNGDAITVCFLLMYSQPAADGTETEDIQEANTNAAGTTRRPPPPTPTPDSRLPHRGHRTHPKIFLPPPPPSAPLSRNSGRRSAMFQDGCTPGSYVVGGTEVLPESRMSPRGQQQSLSRGGPLPYRFWVRVRGITSPQIGAAIPLATSTLLRPRKRNAGQGCAHERSSEHKKETALPEPESLPGGPLPRFVEPERVEFSSRVGHVMEILQHEAVSSASGGQPGG